MSSTTPENSDQFAGFEFPRQNWTKIPHALIDELHRFSTKGELAVVLYVLRHTWGFQDQWKKITLDEFENGRKRKDGSRMDGGVGMRKQAILKGIERAVEDGFLRVKKDTRDAARVEKHYMLNMRPPA